MTRQSTKIAAIVNLIAMPLNIYTFNCGLTNYHRGDYVPGIMFMLMGVVFFLWCGYSVVSLSKKLLTKD